MLLSEACITNLIYKLAVIYILPLIMHIFVHFREFNCIDSVQSFKTTFLDFITFVSILEKNNFQNF